MSTQVELRADAAVLAVTRPRTDPARWRKWSIVLDGQAAGSLKVGDFIELEVSSGRHMVEILGCRWNSCRSNAISVDIPIGSFVKLRASPRGNLGGPVFANVRPVLVAYRIGPGADYADVPA